MVDQLLIDIYKNITVLNISTEVLEKAQLRLGDDGNKVKWIVSDITDFQPDEPHDLWHDRAVFHS